MSREPELPAGVVPGDCLIVVHDFDARTEDELSLRRGDKVELIELDDEFGDGWYLGKHTTRGATGIFPGVYTKAVPHTVMYPTENPPSYVSSTSEQSGSSASAIGDEKNPIESKLPDTNGELTPQASRHVSASSEKMALDIPETTRSATPPMSQHRPSSANMSSSAPLSPGIQRTISETIDNRMNGEDSPVMNETLSVIDEHITDLSTPRHSMVVKEQGGGINDSESDYSSHTDNRLSYIHGHETDEEEENPISEDHVKSWDHLQTAKHLRQLGVDPRHCDIFEEQEITGDVLLEMDQGFIYMKDFDFGVMGRRLKTWHKIKAFQEVVKGIDHYRQSSSAYSGRDGTPDEFDRSQSRNGMTSPFLPRIPSLTGPPGSNYRQSRDSGSSSFQQRYSKRNGMAPARNNIGSPLPSFSTSSTSQHDSLGKPSAASIRDINQSRRHSSIDASPRSPADSLRTKNNLPSTTSHIAHQHKNSFDKSWTMSSGTHVLNDHQRNSLRNTGGSLPRRDMFGRANGNGSDSAITLADSPDEIDRGYFSGGEIDSRKPRNVLKKRDSASGTFSHSAQSSIADKSTNLKRHSRFGSADSIRDMVPQASAASKAYNSSSIKSRFRSSSARSPESPNNQSHSPTVTNLEQTTHSTPGFFSAFSPLTSRPDGDNSGRSSPLPSSQIKSVTPKVRRALGLRAISDAVTGNERDATTSPVPISPLKDTPQSPTRTGSSTPSAASKSFGRDSTDGSSKAGEASIFVNRPKLSVKPGVKSKKETSAYMRGLEKKSPAEQMVDCDYSGWMRKKSSHLMTTWKPRLFVLRGRRLSYYYSKDDTEERGLIDISSHRVLRADQDPITAIHATITGAKASVTSPVGSTHSASPSTDMASPSSLKQNSSDSPFIFKLVPPKTGLSRAVQFTKPSVHFFQVDNVQQGRLWMAALMKATIERDPNLPVEMTNRQKTISLKQARAMNQRPPALMVLDDKDSEPKPEDDLNIHAIIFDDDTPDSNDSKRASFRPGSLG